MPIVLKKIAELYRYLNLLSIDVVTGAVVCAVFLTKAFHGELFITGLLALALSVWIIYTLDHLLDVQYLKQRASTERHRFHQTYSKELQVCLAIAIVTDIIVLFYIRSSVLKIGFIVGFIVLMYLLLHKRLKFFKEMFGALLYTAGISIPSLGGIFIAWSQAHIILLVQLFLTAFINLLIFSWFDRAEDLRDNHNSFVIYFGERIARNFIVLLFCLQCTFIAIQFYRAELTIEMIVILAMNMVLGIVWIFSNFFSHKDRYRLIGDSVFLFPLIYLLK